VEKNNRATAADATVDHDAHAGLLDELLARVASCFARRETRMTCRDMVRGLLAELEDHNCWTMAEAAGHPGPHRMQHLLSRARCAADEERRELAGVPGEIMFATKPQLAGRLLQQAHERGIHAGFVAGDEVYGGLGLRRSIRERGTGYVLAVRSNYTVTLPSGRLAVKKAASLVKPVMWQRMRTGSATKGAKDYHWAMIGITPDDTPEGQDDGHGFLLLRRHRYTGTVSYFLCWSPDPVSLARLISVAVTRWRIEEDHQLSKQAAGLDSGQVTVSVVSPWLTRTARDRHEPEPAFCASSAKRDPLALAARWGAFRGSQRHPQATPRGGWASPSRWCRRRTAAPRPP